MASLFLFDGITLFDLSEQESTGYGLQAATFGGLGPGPVDVQAVSNLNGATFRRTRALPQDYDLKLNVRGTDADDLSDRLRALFRAMEGEFWILSPDGDDYWILRMVRVGGGNYALGTGQVSGDETDIVVTLRAHNPSWEFIGAMTLMEWGDDPEFGTYTFASDSDVFVYPTWTVTGPASSVTLLSATIAGALVWTGTLAAGDFLFIESSSGRILDNDGVNRYDGLSASPRFWPIVPGNNALSVTVTGGNSDTRVQLEYAPRRKVVI